jgi:CO dehydrogenase/acetyl-CoA synthase beta subunit
METSPSAAEGISILDRREHGLVEDLREEEEEEDDEEEEEEEEDISCGECSITMSSTDLGLAQGELGFPEAFFFSLL